jgi:hypothetical protein
MLSRSFCSRDRLLRQEKDEASLANCFCRIVEFEPSFSDSGCEGFLFFASRLLWSLN